MEFDVLVIAMLRETQRRQQVAKSLTDAGVDDFHFLDATDSKEPAQLAAVRGYDALRAKVVRGRELTASEIACFDSHRRSWQWVAERAKPVLVLESDAQISCDMVRVCHELCARSGKELPTWQHVMLYYHECLPSFWGRHKVFGDYRLVRFANRRAYIASSMLLTQVAAKQFLALGQDIYLPVDDFMTGGYVDKKVDLFAVYPPPAALSWTAKLSNIEDERAAISVVKPAKPSLRRYSLWLRQCWRKIRRPPDWL